MANGCGYYAPIRLYVRLREIRVNGYLLPDSKPSAFHTYIRSARTHTCLIINNFGRSHENENIQL
jgi:hypothetical protein